MEEHLPEIENYIDNDTVKLGVQWMHGHPFLHLEAKKWSHTLRKEYYEPTWKEFQRMLREEHDCTDVFVIMDKDEHKQKKFLKSFGFEEIHSDGNLLALSKEL